MRAFFGVHIQAPGGIVVAAICPTTSKGDMNLKLLDNFAWCRSPREVNATFLLHGFRQRGFTVLHGLNATNDDDAGTDPGSTLMLVHAPSTATSQRRGSGAARQAFTREVHRWGHNVDIFRTSSCYSTVVLVLRVEPSGVEDTVSIERVPCRLPDEITP